MPPPKTLLLVFIHGFKGNDATFGNFPSHLKALLAHALPTVSIQSTVYPSFETRGDLASTVSRFSTWLTDKVIDLEVSAGTPSPTVEPRVRVVLVGHSMGGIVAAETLLGIAAQTPVSGSGSVTGASSLMFPFIQAILAFDTPYLGIAPGVVAHGAEKHWNTVETAYSAYNSLASSLGWGGGGTTTPPATTPPRAIEPPPQSQDAASAPLWQKYSRIAMFAGAAGAIAAGGAAAYMKKDTISQGWGWATSHLEFVGALARPEEMRGRLSRVVALCDTGVGFANLYTTLGHAVDSASKSAQTQTQGWTGKVKGVDRTFCNLPKPGSRTRTHWIPAVNDRVSEETLAHVSMFDPKSNPGYYTLSETAKETVLEWTAGDSWFNEQGGETVDGEAEMVERSEAEEEFVKLSRPSIEVGARRLY